MGIETLWDEDGNMVSWLSKRLDESKKRTRRDESRKRSVWQDFIYLGESIGTRRFLDFAQGWLRLGGAPCM